MRVWPDLNSGFLHKAYDQCKGSKLELLANVYDHVEHAARILNSSILVFHFKICTCSNTLHPIKIP